MSMYHNNLTKRTIFWYIILFLCDSPNARRSREYGRCEDGGRSSDEHLLYGTSRNVSRIVTMSKELFLNVHNEFSQIESIESNRRIERQELWLVASSTKAKKKTLKKEKKKKKKPKKDRQCPRYNRKKRRDQVRNSNVCIVISH